jgi:23S rRNA pseudouridine2605 synthase
VSSPKVSLARALSKLGHSSRSESERLIADGRVSVNGIPITNPAQRVDLARDRIAVDGALVRSADKIYLLLNKPRGLVTTADDERGRATVYSCLPAELPHVSPVGRLDRDSEGVLLFTNDTRWANAILAPESHVVKTYHVLADGIVSEEDLLRMSTGVEAKRGDWLAVRHVRVLRRDGATTWLEIGLDEGRNRHIRRLLETLGLKTLRLIRVAIGPITLGHLGKGEFRPLERAEVDAVAPGSSQR